MADWEYRGCRAAVGPNGMRDVQERVCMARGSIFKRKDGTRQMRAKDGGGVSNKTRLKPKAILLSC